MCCVCFCICICMLPLPATFFFISFKTHSRVSSLDGILSSTIAFMPAVSSSSGAGCLVWNGCCAALLGWYAFDDGSWWRSSSLPVWWTHSSYTWVWWSKDIIQHYHGFSSAGSWFHCFSLHHWKYITCSFTIWCLRSFWSAECQGRDFIPAVLLLLNEWLSFSACFQSFDCV